MRAHEAGALHADIGHRAPQWLRAPRDPNELVAALWSNTAKKNGEGALFPAVVVGVGSLGRLVVEALRGVICDRYGALDKVPHVRFLYIDTDPEAGSLHVGASGGTPLAPHNILTGNRRRETR